MKEVAAALGVSTMTVSRAINNKPNVDPKTRKKILEVASQMGYTPNHVAKSLVSSRTFTIGVVIPEISHSFFPEVVRGIQEESNKKNYQIFLTNTSDDFTNEQQIINALRSKRVDGLLISSSLGDADYSYYEQIIKAGPPVVFFDRCISGIGASCIGINDFQASRLITNHLINNGYKRVAYLSGPRVVSIGKDRYDGFLSALNDNGLTIFENLIIESGYNEKGGYHAMKKLLELPVELRPDAVVAVNDPVAFGAMDAIINAGLSIPDDIAIVGFTDDIRAPLVHSPLTTIHQPAYEVGKQAVMKLINAIENRREPIEHILLPTEIVIRKSCGS